MTLFDVSVHAKGLDLTDGGCRGASGRGDPRRLRQILTNLLNDALRITE